MRVNWGFAMVRVLAIVILLALPLLSTGCMTAEDKMKKQIAEDDTRCLSYGVERGTPAYVSCRAQLDQNRANITASENVGTGAQEGVIPGLIRRLSQ